MQACVYISTDTHRHAHIRATHCPKTVSHVELGTEQLL